MDWNTGLTFDLKFYCPKIQCYRAREQNFLIFIIIAPKLVKYWYFSNVYSHILYLNRETIQVQLPFQQNVANLTLIANISRMQAPQDFSSGIIAYYYNFYMVHKCGLLTESKSGNLIPNVFLLVLLKIWHVFANISVILLSYIEPLIQYPSLCQIGFLNTKWFV